MLILFSILPSNYGSSQKSAQNGGAENQPLSCYFKILPLPPFFPGKFSSPNHQQ
jgi:hypothetical protein